MLLQRNNWLLALGLVVSACSISGSPDDNNQQPPPDMPPPTNPDPVPEKPIPPTPAVYKRSSLRPLYELTPEGDLSRFVESGVVLSDADFTVNGGVSGFTTHTQKMENITQQINRERTAAGLPTEPAIISAGDRLRSDRMPFRGNPMDVKIVSVNGRREALVPLGGGVSVPGNELVVVDITNAAQPTRVTTIQVGLRPIKVVAHPSKPTQLAFVCNKYSNYITIVDLLQNKVLVGPDGKEVEVKTDFYCEDLVFAPQNANAQDPDKQDLYVANSYRGTVMKYPITLVRQGIGNAITNVTVGDVKEITGVGANPMKLLVSQDLRTLFVANSRGGELARVDLVSQGVRKITFNAPVPDVVQANDILILPTTTVDRGLPARDDQIPAPVFSPPVMVTGADGQQHQAHPGSQVDNTKAYNFEDMRNGMLTVDAQLNNNVNTVYYTDDISPERNFVAQQKILKGSIPQSVVIDQRTHTRVFAAMSGNDTIQEFQVVGGAFRLRDAATPEIRTGKRPFALALDENANEIISVNWGGETMEIFDANSGQRKSVFDLGYAAVAYPATTIERGEYLFYNTGWANNGRKSCGQCHLDDLLLDGVPYANGATASTAYHKVPANFNLMTTNNYFWNGSFSNGTYASLASDAQSRSNCELILFGLIEGISSDPATRVGDPNHNIGSLGAATDQQCRPDLSSLVSGVLPANFDDVIAPIIAQSKLQRDAQIKVITAAQGLPANFGFNEVSRAVDAYDIAIIRLPPNPIDFQYKADTLDSATKAAVDRGKETFGSAGCGRCHNPATNFTDNKNHGSGATWPSDFVRLYGNDQRLLALLPQGIPTNMTVAIAEGGAVTNDPEINVHASVDAFIPFCFDDTHCLQFDDPLAAAPQSQLETNRLEAIIKINLGNNDRGFVPGNVPGKFAVNTPSLRGLFVQNNFLRHGLARSLNETILAPGHAALKPNEKGFAVDRFGKTNVHGTTENLTPQQVDDLYLYLTSIP